MLYSNLLEKPQTAVRYALATIWIEDGFGLKSFIDFENIKFVRIYAEP